jgi:hypothetical protein
MKVQRRKAKHIEYIYELVKTNFVNIYFDQEWGRKCGVE